MFLFFVFFKGADREDFMSEIVEVMDKHTALRKVSENDKLMIFIRQYCKTLHKHYFALKNNNFNYKAIAIEINESQNIAQTKHKFTEMCQKIYKFNNSDSLVLWLGVVKYADKLKRREIEKMTQITQNDSITTRKKSKKNNSEFWNENKGGEEKEDNNEEGYENDDGYNVTQTQRIPRKNEKQIKSIKDDRYIIKNTSDFPHSHIALPNTHPCFTDNKPAAHAVSIISVAEPPSQNTHSNSALAFHISFV